MCTDRQCPSRSCVWPNIDSKSLLRVSGDSAQVPVRASLSLGPTICVGILLLTMGCSTTTPLIAPAQDWTPVPPTVLIVPPDARVALLTVGGMEEERADWSQEARANLDWALEEVLRTKGIGTLRYEHVEGAVPWQREDAPIIKLHEAVGSAVRRAPLLPTQAGKRPNLEYSLGPAVHRLKEAYGADYALFVHNKTTHASGGRVAVSLIAAFGGVSVPLGMQVAFASLVDLDDGKVIWFRDPFIQGTAFSGDIREREGAQAVVEVLLEGLPL